MSETIDGTPITTEGRLLSEVYGRMVAWHHTLATTIPLPRDAHAIMMRDIMATLRKVEENPQFRSANEDEMAPLEPKTAARSAWSGG